MHNLTRFTKPILKMAVYRALVGRTRATHRPAQGRFTRAELARILEDVWHRVDELAPSIQSLPREATFGARMNVRFACLTNAFYQALVAVDIEKDEAIRLTADVIWRVYQKWGLLPRLISIIFAREPLERLRVCTVLFRRFPFNPPGYVMEGIPDKDSVAFNVRRCPVAEYFRSQKLSEVCVGTWCNQDYALAEQWGGKLERSQTIAAGCDHCDFRWKAPSKQPIRNG